MQASCSIGRPSGLSSQAVVTWKAAGLLRPLLLFCCSTDWASFEQVHMLEHVLIVLLVPQALHLQTVLYSRLPRGARPTPCLAQPAI